MSAASRTAGALRAGVLGVAAALLWWPLTLPGAAALAGVAGFAAARVADRHARRRPPQRTLRTASGALLAGLAAACAWGAARLLVRLPWPAEWLGPVAALRTSETVLAVGLSAAAIFALRLAAARRPLLALAELVGVGAAFVAGLAAHRQGMVHRPQVFGDFAWSRGVDPTLVFLALGGLCLLLLAALLLSEARLRRVPLHLSALVLIAAFLAVFVRLSGLPQPRPPSDLGLTGAGAEGDEAARGRALESRPRSQLDDLEFKDAYADDGNLAPVAVVVLHDDYSPPTGIYYFRQSVFSRYNGRRLVQALGGDVDLDVIDHFPTARLELAWRPPASDRRRSLRTTTGLLLDHIRPFALDSPVAIEARENEDELRFQRTYDAESLVGILGYDEMLGAPAGSPEWSPETWRHYIEAPADPRYAELARQALSVLRPDYAGDPLARALAVKHHLDRHGTYSRRSGHAGQDDPVASFLFGDLTGYCVHFAHAAVYLLRTLGVPARVAAGYAVPETDRAGGSAILIRALNAHAWPEIFLDGVGWVVVDLAPDRYLDPAAPHPDQALQSMLGELLRRGRRGDGPPEEAPGPGLDPRQLLAALAGLAAALLAGAFAVKLYRALVPRLAPSSQLPRLCYRAALDRLAEVGMVRRYGESRERFARRAAGLSGSFGPLTALHLRFALGGEPRPGGRAARGLAREVARELRARVRPWRVTLGILDPFAWLRSR